MNCVLGFIFILANIVNAWEQLPSTSLRNSVRQLFFMETNLTDSTPILVTAQLDTSSNQGPILIYYQWDSPNQQLTPVIYFPLPQFYDLSTFYFIKSSSSPSGSPLLIALCNDSSLMICIVDLWFFTIQNITVSSNDPYWDFFITELPNTLFAISYDTPGQYTTWMWELNTGQLMGIVPNFPNTFSYTGFLSLSNSLYSSFLTDPDQNAQLYMWSSSQFINIDTIFPPEYNISLPSFLPESWIPLSNNEIFILASDESQPGIYCLGAYIISVMDNEVPIIMDYIPCLSDKYLDDLPIGQSIRIDGTSYVVVVTEDPCAIVLLNAGQSITVESDQWIENFSFSESIYPEDMVAVPVNAKSLFPFDFILSLSVLRPDETGYTALIPFLINSMK